MSLQADTTIVTSRSLVDQVALAYEGILHRAPEDGGLDGWVDVLQAGGTINQVIQGILGSSEAAYLSSLSTQDFVSQLYRNVLNREPDSAGLSNWLNSGLSRDKIAEGITQSQEALIVQGSALHGYEQKVSEGSTGISGSTDLSSFTPAPVIKEVPVYIDTSTPTAEAHHLTFTEDGQLPVGTTKPDGTFLSGNGTANAGFTTLVDQDAGVALSIRAHPRQSGSSYDATTQLEGNTLHVAYTINAGPQNNDAGANPTRGDGSLDFQAARLGLATLATNPDGSVDDYSLRFAFSSPNQTISAHLAEIDPTHFAVVSDRDGTVLIADFPANGNVLANSTNLGFGIFAGTPDVPAGQYGLDMYLVDNTGIDAGRVVAHLDVNITAVDPHVPQIMG